MSRGNVRIRPACARDEQHFVRLVGELRAVANGTAPHSRVPSADEGTDLAARYGQILAGDRWQVLMAVDLISDQPLGMAIVSKDEISALVGTPAVHVSHLVVAREQRRRGIGRMLMSTAVTTADDWGCEHVIVAVSVGRREAHRFFARLGFTPLHSSRIATVSTLRRTLGPRDSAADGVAVRRRLRPTRALTRPLPMQRLRRGGAL